MAREGIRIGSYVAQGIGVLLAMLIAGLLMRLGQISSVKGFMVGALVGSIIFVMGKIALYFLDEDSEDEEESFVSSWFSYGALAVFALVSTLSFYWDEPGFCEVQTNAETVNIGPQSIMDILENKNRTRIDIYSVKEDCLKVGAWEYMSTAGATVLVTSALFSVPYLFVLSLGLVGPLLEGREQRAAEISRKNPAIVPGIGKSGRMILLRSGKESDLEFFLKNVKDIVEKQHLSKGDYSDWFGRLAKEFLANRRDAEKILTSEELKGYLKWALERVPEVYKGKSESTGVKRASTLLEYLGKI